MRTNSGFTLVELMVSLAIVSILAATAIPAYQSFRERAYDATAESDLTNIVKGIYALQTEGLGDQTVIWLNLNGPESLPPPMREIKLSDGTIARWIVKLPLGDGNDLIYVWVEHQSGAHMFRYWELLGSRTRQRIRL
ncbi:MAG: prepilin-type N-terminal cleavage/methylation domain-containing protein [Bdellovibrionales bacterium]|nr:prepilin-type N-terminal cleavage/methylation domain-containing protein [Bdellovibrionales bacterium]